MWTCAQNVHRLRLGSREYGRRVNDELTSVSTQYVALRTLCDHVNCCSTTAQEAGLVDSLGVPGLCLGTSCTVPTASNLRRQYLCYSHIFLVFHQHLKTLLRCLIAKLLAAILFYRL
jgi:hypothetical protein